MRNLDLLTSTLNGSPRGGFARAGALALAFFALAPSVCLAEMYRWVDRQGNSYVTDDLFNVPQEYLQQIITYQESKGPSDSGDIPLAKTDLGYVIDAKLNGVADLKLLLDTGATATVISPSALARGGVAMPAGRDVRMRTAGGEVQAGSVQVMSLSIGGIKRPNLRVIAHDAVPGADGLLGMDFLGAYRFEILTYGPKLRLSPQ